MMKNRKRFIRSYNELIRLETFEERFEYLRLGGIVGESTFGFDRYVNQMFYRSPEWKRVRREVIARDNGCDMADEDHPIGGRIIIHHINPIELEDIEESTEFLLDPNNLVCVSELTHNAIHFGDKSLLPEEYVERKPFDTCPWKS